MTKKHVLSWLFMALLCLPAFAQIQDPVKFKTEWNALSDNEAEIIFTGTVDKGWHVYSTDLPEGGPISATFNVDKIEGAELIGKLTPRGKQIEKMDPIFGMQVRFFESKAQFVQKIKLTGGAYKLTGYLEYGACNDEIAFRRPALISPLPELLPANRLLLLLKRKEMLPTKQHQAIRHKA